MDDTISTQSSLRMLAYMFGAMDLENLFQQPLNLAHLEDRKAKEILNQEEVDYQAAIECHQKAHKHIRSVLLKISPSSQHQHINDILLTSLYGQLDYHIREQTILLNRQKRDIIEQKRKEYIATIREKATEIALLSSVAATNNIQAKLTQTDHLLKSLKSALDPPVDELSIATAEGTAAYGRKFPKGYSDTIEELQLVNEQLKHFVNDLLNENINLKTELQSHTAVDLHENTFPAPDTSATTSSEPKSPVCKAKILPPSSLPLELAPLEQPEFDKDILQDSDDSIEAISSD